jgi:hypothetical protein
LYFAKKHPNVDWNVTDQKNDPKNSDWIPQEGHAVVVQKDLPQQSKLDSLCTGKGGSDFPNR